MHQQRRNHLLSVIASVSLLPATILICGYFANAGPTLTDVQISPIAQVRSTSVELDSGRILIWLATQTPPPTGATLGRKIRWSTRPDLPDLKRCFWEFDNHSLNSVLKNKGATAYIIAFPIWCVLIPCLIAPILWLRKRRHSRTKIGFPIEVTAK
jgi:hypothetical protein